MSFQKVATLNEIPRGEPRVVMIGDKEIAIARGDDGKLYAFNNLCPHEEGSLHMGFVEKCEIECPLHGAKFDMRTGGVLQGPAYAPMETFPLRIDGDDILVDAQEA